MRMKYLSLIAIFSFVCFTGCGISDDARTPSNDESATYYLCKYWWHAEYVDVHNTRYIQELDFHKDGTGVEIIGKHQQANGNSTREEYHFKWNWGSSHKTISVQYDEGNAVFMDNVFIADRKFSYKMMGEEYFFDGFNKSYRHYKIFCVNGNTGFRNESRIFYFIHLQNEEAYERKESSSA